MVRIASPDDNKVIIQPPGFPRDIGEADRHSVNSHPDAFTCKDYREAFEKHVDKFDAVIVSVPDHSHAPILLTAMLHHKHVYGQKPLVHPLTE